MNATTIFLPKDSSFQTAAFLDPGNLRNLRVVSHSFSALPPFKRIAREKFSCSRDRRFSGNLWMI